MYVHTHTLWCVKHHSEKVNTLMPIITFISHAFNTYFWAISMCKVLVRPWDEKRFVRRLTVWHTHNKVQRSVTAVIATGWKMWAVKSGTTAQGGSCEWTLECSQSWQQCSVCLRFCLVMSGFWNMCSFFPNYWKRKKEGPTRSKVNAMTLHLQHHGACCQTQGQAGAADNLNLENQRGGHILCFSSRSTVCCW